MHVPVTDVAALIETSERILEKAVGASDGTLRSLHALHKAEQVRPLVHLAADSGARRGELVALCFGDFHGRVFTIERAASAEEVGPTKTRQVRRLTLGRTTAELWTTS
jgi:integrase